MLHDFLKDFFSIRFFKQYCSLIKYYFIASAVLFILSIIIGVIFADSFKYIMAEVVKNMVNNISINGMTFGSIFFNNIRANLMIICGGILFSIFSLFALFFNGILIGFVGSGVSTLTFLLYIIPHGIFELPAIILSFATSLIVTKLTIRLLKGIFNSNLNVKTQLVLSKDLIKTILMSICVIFVLLVIAAFIEVYITPILAKFLLNILI